MTNAEAVPGGNLLCAQYVKEIRLPDMQFL